MKKKRAAQIFILGIIGGLALNGCSRNHSDLKTEQTVLVETEYLLETQRKAENETIQEIKNKNENKNENRKEKNTSDMQKIVQKQEEDWYRNSIQNLHQGNSITYADGYYYFCSQYDYSLCRLKETGGEAEVLAEQMPAEICVYQDLVYFINASDRQTLYCIGTDGENLTKLGDFPMQNMVLIEGKIYFLSVYEREEDPFYQLVEEPAEGDRYLYVIDLDQSSQLKDLECRLLVAKVCEEFTADGEWLYYICRKDSETILYRSGRNGEKEEIIWQGEERIFHFVPYQGKLYSSISKENIRYFAELREGEWEILREGGNFFIAEGVVYLYNCSEINSFCLETGEKEKQITIVIGEREREFDFTRARNEGIFFVNNSLICKCWESEEKGIVWHIWQEDKKQFLLLEDIEPFDCTMLVGDTSWDKEYLFYKPGEANDIQYLDGERKVEESYGVKEDGAEYGIFSLRLPLFGTEIQGRELINQKIIGIEKLALEDRDSFFQEIQREEKDGHGESCRSWFRQHDYSNLYVGKHYISLCYYVRGYSGGMRQWEEAVPLTFNRETGEYLTMDQLFTVDKNIYMKRLSSAIYKYGELNGGDYRWNESFYRNVLVKNFDPYCFYLTPDGIVLCYQRYAVAAGAAGNPAFEISYSWFEDIFIEE